MGTTPDPKSYAAIENHVCQLVRSLGAVSVVENESTDIVMIDVPAEKKLEMKSFVYLESSKRRNFLTNRQCHVAHFNRY